MALRRTLTKRLFHRTIIPVPPPSPAMPPTAAPFSHPHREFFTSPDSTAPAGFFRRFLQRRDINHHSASATPLPSFLTLPVGEKLREKVKSLSSAGGNRIRLDGLSPPSTTAVGESFGRVSVADAKRLLRFMQLERIRERIRNIPVSTIQYGEYVRICGDVCGDSEVGSEFAKALEESGNVIVLGGVVFLHPDQVTKSMEKLISQSVAMPKDPRREELAQLEKKKALIDKTAQSMVRAELYCGLGFLVVQTLGFMRLTFWELSWDVMEPICFFVTSFHFLLAYAFFLRTSKEPTFEGFFQRRLRVKQEKLMKIHDFDLERYNQLVEAFYPKGYDHWRRTSYF